jgi:hypothetical protein
MGSCCKVLRLDRSSLKSVKMWEPASKSNIKTTSISRRTRDFLNMVSDFPAISIEQSLIDSFSYNERNIFTCRFENSAYRGFFHYRKTWTLTTFRKVHSMEELGNLQLFLILISGQLLSVLRGSLCVVSCSKHCSEQQLHK